MGCITGYFVPIWCHYILEDHSRTLFDSLLTNKFTGKLDHILTTDTLLVSYSAAEQKPYFYNKWFSYKNRFTGHTDSEVSIPNQEMTVGEAIAAASAPPSLYHPYDLNSTTD